MSNTKTLALIFRLVSRYLIPVDMMPTARTKKKNESNNFWEKELWVNPKSEIKAIRPKILTHKAN